MQHSAMSEQSSHSELSTDVRGVNVAMVVTGE
jgi:hypothetical protein